MIPLVVVFGLVFAYFAAQNTAVVTISFFNLAASHVPLFLVILCSFFVGLLMGHILKLIQSLSCNRKVVKLKKEVSQMDEKNIELRKQVHELQINEEKLLKKIGPKQEVSERSL